MKFDFRRSVKETKCELNRLIFEINLLEVQRCLHNSLLVEDEEVEMIQGTRFVKSWDWKDFGVEAEEGKFK